MTRVFGGNDPVSIGDFDCFINLDLSYEKNTRVHILDAYGFYAFGENVNFDRTCELFSSDEDRRVGQQVSADSNMPQKWFPRSVVTCNSKLLAGRVVKEGSQLVFPKISWRCGMG